MAHGTDIQDIVAIHDLGETEERKKKKIHGGFPYYVPSVVPFCYTTFLRNPSFRVSFRFSGAGIGYMIYRPI